MILVTADFHVFVPMRMAITATGVVHFYITLRGPDVEARHKVPWFFEAALAAAVITIFAGALDLALRAAGARGPGTPHGIRKCQMDELKLRVGGQRTGDANT